MANGEWFKNIINFKKAKANKPRKLKGSSTHRSSNGWMSTNRSSKVSSKLANNFLAKIHGMDGMPIEHIAATHIQSAFRAYKAREAFRCLKGTGRLKTLVQGYSAKRQTSTTLSCLHSWSMMQAEVKARRMSMVMEGRIRQKKLENQHKLEVRLQDLEVEWNSGSETMEEVLSKIHQREEAALKRERTLAYAFSHQWRPNSNLGLTNPVFGNENWGWSWMDRWIAARPWENRVLVRDSPKKGHSHQNNMVNKNLTTPLSTKVNVKTVSPNKVPSKARKLTYQAPEKLNHRKSTDNILAC